MVKNTLLKTSMEAIHFQDGQLGAKIELVIESLRNSEQSQKNIKKHFTNLSEIIFDSLGILTEFQNDENILAAVYVPTVHIDHIFNNEMYHEYYKNDLKRMLKLAKQHKENSVVDLKNSFISGVFSKINNIILLSLNTLFRKENSISTPEITAIILHELGHLFGCFEYATRTITTNQAISIVSKALMEQTQATEYEIVLEQVSQLIGKDKNSLKEFQEIKDARIVSTLIIDRCREQAKSELNTSFYDYSTFEYIADQFATRHGYGKHLIHGLEKISKGFMSLDHSDISHIFATITTITTTIVSGLLVVGGVMSANVGAIFIGGILLIGQFLGASYLNGNFTYDTLKVRYKRIREQEIQYLKLGHVEGKNKQEVIDSLDQMKELIDKMVIYQPIYQRLINFISKKNRDAKAAYDLQRDLEELASNELFVKAAQLSTLQK